VTILTLRVAGNMGSVMGLQEYGRGKDGFDEDSGLANDCRGKWRKSKLIYQVVCVVIVMKTVEGIAVGPPQEFKGCNPSDATDDPFVGHLRRMEYGIAEAEVPVVRD